MFNTRLQYQINHYDEKGYVGFKLTSALIIACVVGFFTVRALSEPSPLPDETPYVFFMFLLKISGFISVICSVFLLDYLVSVTLGSLRYLAFFEVPKIKTAWLTFKLDTVFDVTLKNPIFLWTSLSLGHFVGIFERYTHINALGTLPAKETALGYYFTYVKFPLLIGLYGIGVITVVYIVAVMMQKPVVHFLLNKKNSPALNRVLDFLKQLHVYAKKKSLLIVFVGLAPSLLLTLHALGILSEEKSLAAWILFYMKCAMVAYPLTVLAGVLAKTAKQERSTDVEQMPSNATPLENITPIIVSDYVDKEVEEAIAEINQIVHDINPYLELVAIEETHVLKRITEQEVVNLIKHYNKLSSDTKKEVKQVLLARLHSAKKTAKEISEIAQVYHHDAFQKQAHLMENRYANEEKNAN